MSRRFARPGGPTGSEHILAGTVTASATPHTFGAWVQIDASVAQDACGIWIGSNVAVAAAGTDTAMIVDLGFGAAAAEVSQVLHYVGGAQANTFVFIPLYIPQGIRLSARIQALITLDTYVPRVILEFCDGRFAWGGFSIGEAIGLDLATSAPTTGDLTDNAWDEAIASTANPYRALTLHMGSFGTGMTNANIVVDIGVGGAGAEQALGSWHAQTSSNEQTFCVIGPRFVAQPIAAGSRLAIRKNSTADLTAHLIGWR